MDQWPHQVIALTQQEIIDHCVKDFNWQEFRQKLKSLSTNEKLRLLNGYWLTSNGDAAQRRRAKIQVSNYINALKRGGQLSMDLKVQR